MKNDVNKTMKNLELKSNTFLLSRELSDKRKVDWSKRNKNVKIKVGDFIKLLVIDNDKHEHLWFEVVGKDIARCDNFPVMIKNINYGDIIQFKFNDIEDLIPVQTNENGGENKMKTKEKKSEFRTILDGKFLTIETDDEIYIVSCYMGCFYLCPEDYQVMMTDLAKMFGVENE